MRAFAVAVVLASTASAALAHGGGLNACGCHFDRKTGECHCHRPSECGCECEPAWCSRKNLGGETFGAGDVETPPAVRGSDQPAAPDVHALTVADPEPELLSGGCGVERWKVKTMSDSAAKGLHRQRARNATVEQLSS